MGIIQHSAIEFNFAEAKVLAEALEKIAEDMKNLSSNKMAEIMSLMSSSWKGESASAYFTKVEALRSNIHANARRLENIAAGIRSAAKRIYDAEMAALQLAENRSSGGGGGGGGGGAW
jgi:uncharacterized protein YukE